MLNMKMLDVAIGVVFFFSIASLICSTARELIESLLLKSKPKMLERTLREILNDDLPTAGAPEGDSAMVAFFNHPLIDSLFIGQYAANLFGETKWGKRAVESVKAFSSNRNLPSYIPPSNFAGAILDIVRDKVVKVDKNAWEAATTPELRLEALRKILLSDQTPLLRGETAPSGATAHATGAGAAASVQRKTATNDRLNAAVLWAINNADGDFEKAKKNLEGWYENAMQRATGRYKRDTQAWLLLIGLIVATLFNLDTMTIVQKLYQSDAARAAAIAGADAYAKRLVSTSPGANESGPEPKPAEGAREAASPTPSNPPKPTAAAVKPAGEGGKTAAPASLTAVPPVGAPAATKAGEPPSPPAGSTPDLVLRRVEDLEQTLKDADYPVGWTKESLEKFRETLRRYRERTDGTGAPLSEAEYQAARAAIWSQLLGWALTAIAMTLGAPFWFDLLSKLVSLRTSVKPEDAQRAEKAKEEEKTLKIAL
ncbi:MAG TPA: hypothetical protein VK446_00740 [Methylocystis sp.]|nr:hypothetical protein [Methylocystis sp.]